MEPSLFFIFGYVWSIPKFTGLKEKWKTKRSEEISQFYVDLNGRWSHKLEKTTTARTAQQPKSLSIRQWKWWMEKPLYVMYLFVHKYLVVNGKTIYFGWFYFVLFIFKRWLRKKLALCYGMSQILMLLLLLFVSHPSYQFCQSVTCPITPLSMHFCISCERCLPVWFWEQLATYNLNILIIYID